MKQRVKTVQKVNFRCSIRMHGGEFWKKAGLLAAFFVYSGILSGCNTAELEEREFPIEIAVDHPKDFGAEWLGAGKDGNRVVDYNHLKVIIISKAFLEKEESMEEFLELLEDKGDVPRNTYIVAAENAAEILNLEKELGDSAGNYIEELLENVSDVNKKAYPTLGMLYQEEENQTETYYIPFFKVEDNKPVIDHYYVWKRGHAAGGVDSETAMLAFFTQNNLEAYTLKLENGQFIRLFDAKNEISFPKEEGSEITVTIRCNGEVMYQSPKEEVSLQMLEEMAERYMNKTAAAALDQQIDVSGSYRRIGGGKRSWYFYYRENGEQYERDVHIVYNVQITWVTL